MDEIFDQWFSSSPWTANGASANRPVFWDASAAAAYHNSAGVMPMDSAADFQAQHKASENSILAGMGLERQGGSLTHGIYEGNASSTPQPPIFDTGQGHNLPLQPMHPAWYVGGVPLAGGDLNTGKAQAFTLEQVDPPADDPHSGKWQQDDDSLSTENCPWNTPHLAASEGIKSVQSSDDQVTSVAPDPSGGAAGGSSKSRVRARRGQATDPHSIAERHRRERIAERMKALQELVPDSNKTDKASMLDEIIHYVKFLQMQVKCLSMCRLGGAGAAGPLLAELPVEGASSLMETSTALATSTDGGSSTSLKEGMAFAERQVARLMDEDMSAAMQYLQSKGLCLMPISLATAISSSGVRPPPTKVGLDTTDGNMK